MLLWERFNFGSLILLLFWGSSGVLIALDSAIQRWAQVFHAAVLDSRPELSLRGARHHQHWS